MTVRELLYEATQYNHETLIVLIEFLVLEKETVKLEDDESVLELYFKPNNADRMNKLLKEYMQQKEG